MRASPADSHSPPMNREAASTAKDTIKDQELPARVREDFVETAQWWVLPDVFPALDGLSSREWTHLVLSNHVTELSSIARGPGLGEGARGARPPRLQFRRNRLREAAPGGVPLGPVHLGRRGRGGTACRRRRPGGGLRTGTLRQPRLARISPRPVTSDSRPVSPCSEPPTKEET